MKYVSEVLRIKDTGFIHFLNWQHFSIKYDIQTENNQYPVRIIYHVQYVYST